MATIIPEIDAKDLVDIKRAPDDDGFGKAGRVASATDHGMGTTVSTAQEASGIVAASWTVRTLIIGWAGALLLSFVLIYDSQTLSAYQPYATSSFSSVSLLGTIATVQAVVETSTRPRLPHRPDCGANKPPLVMYIPLAKLSDVYGRGEMFAVSVLFATIGQIMLATSRSISVYAGAQIFFVLGAVGLKCMLQLFAGDTSNLMHRSFMSAVPTMPAIITSWTASLLANAVLKGASWRWGYGIFAILFPVTSLPLLITLFYHQRKAARSLGPRPRFDMHKQLTHLKELDPIGLLFFSAALALIVVPITISQTNTGGWGSAHIIAMLVVGVVSAIIFVVWELKWAKYTMLPPAMLKNRTVAVSVIIAILNYGALYCYYPYLFTFVVVNGNHSTVAGTNMVILPTFCLVFGQIIGAISLRYFGRYKWTVLFGNGVQVISFGLLYKFRHTAHSLAGMIVSLVLYGLGGGMFSVLQTGCQASVSQGAMATVTALFWTGLNLGSSVGGAISGGIWTNLLPNKLKHNLPASAQSELAAIEGSIVVAMEVPWGSALRDSINLSYDETMRVMMMTALIVQACAFLMTLLLKDIDLKAVDSTRDYGGAVVGQVDGKAKQHSGQEMDKELEVYKQ
ncbi:hypothetical protein A1O3_10267 [Capronia epimyces CBS 606.96]|uniref:Major facilitator superfamily (MFS) profile domain-containing protein n=1 Tax=Capronia epimyces CBS 606.96 TaxID=1182542 RepID=W9Y3R3_9EURO|nr:uncharacterized protein A1O3_10267 [Capronia epimyces CBS 606.96]EXJ77109.1 hypothetical protein A1O3_10267 [Capronia epimyces CBS 606.96]